MVIAIVEFIDHLVLPQKKITLRQVVIYNQLRVNLLQTPVTLVPFL